MARDVGPSPTVIYDPILYLCIYDIIYVNSHHNIYVWQFTFIMNKVHNLTSSKLFKTLIYTCKVTCVKKRPYKTKVRLDKVKNSKKPSFLHFNLHHLQGQYQSHPLHHHLP